MKTFSRLFLGPIAIGLVAAILVIALFSDQLQTGSDITIKRADSPSYSNAQSGNDFSISGPSSYADAVDQAAPAVVNIYTTKIVTRPRHPLLDDPNFRRFFGLDIHPNRQRMQSSLGSGVVISPQGYILTNNHVIAGASEIQVALKDGREALARVVGTDPETDLAVLQVQLKNLPTVTLASSDTARVGDVVLAIGNPFGFGQTVTMGIISAKGRSGLHLSTYEDFIQTDAAINLGNSGGALINTHGHMIALNTAIYSQAGGSVGIGFAIPSQLAEEIMLEIIEKGKVTRGWLGIVPQIMSDELASQLALGDKRGVIIADLFRDGPAHQAGLKPGDIIVAINGEAIRNERDAMNLIAKTQPGAKVSITYTRNGKRQTVEAEVGVRPGVKQPQTPQG